MQTIIEAHATPAAARARKDTLRRGGIHAFLLHNYAGITYGSEMLERMRQTTTVAWYCTVPGLFDTED
jgi:hypothetical protein